MKKVLLISAMALGLCAQAQISKGRMMLGGSFNYGQNNNHSNDSLGGLQQQNKNGNFTGSLKYGYFVTDHVMVGVVGSYQQNNVVQKNIYSPSFETRTNLTSHNFSGGLFARYYKMIGKSRFAVYGELSSVYGGGTGKQKNITVNNSVETQNAGTKISESFFRAGVNPGVVFFMTKHVAIETSFGYLGYNFRNTKMYDNNSRLISDGVNSGFNTQLAFSLSSLALGVNFYFGGPKSQATPAVE